ncbi:MAG TPA: phosphotransferase [Vicinamibacterales bacterium]|nr:phosphotransferase [Vicinamibacterales bacterium]
MMVTASLLAPDPSLPGRDELLDVSAMRERLSSLLVGGIDSRIGSLAVARVNYSAGKAVRAVYRAEIDGVTRTIAARMFIDRAKSEDVFQRSQPHGAPVASLRGVAHDGSISSVFWVFPNDRKIRSLEAAIRPSLSARAIHTRSAVSTRLVAYAPEKAATLVCESADNRAIAYLKVTADDQALRDRHTYDGLRSTLDPRDTALRLPAPLAVSNRRRTLWLEALDGRRVAASLGDEVEIADLERLGAAVAVFHRLAAPGVPRFDRFSPPHLAGDAAMIRVVRPDVAVAADALAAHLTAAAVPDDDVACLHGDLHPKNAIACADRMALIDVESVAMGPAAADLGSLLAGLVYRRETQRLSPDACRARARAFLAGYASRRRLPSSASLAWHTAAALFRERAARAVKRVRPLGLQSMPALVAAAERLLDRGVETL